MLDDQRRHFSALQGLRHGYGAYHGPSMGHGLAAQHSNANHAVRSSSLRQQSRQQAQQSYYDEGVGERLSVYPLSTNTGAPPGLDGGHQYYPYVQGSAVQHMQAPQTKTSSSIFMPEGLRKRSASLTKPEELDRHSHNFHRTDVDPKPVSRFAWSNNNWAQRGPGADNIGGNREPVGTAN